VPVLRTRHRYLAELPTKKLQKVIFECQNMGYSSNNAYQMLTSPCMARITSLCLVDTDKWGDCDVLSARSSLPHLKIFVCFNIKLIEALLPKRTITHLYFLKTKHRQKRRFKLSTQINPKNLS